MFGEIMWLDFLENYGAGIQGGFEGVAAVFSPSYGVLSDTGTLTSMSAVATLQAANEHKKHVPEAPLIMSYAYEEMMELEKRQKIALVEGLGADTAKVKDLWLGNQANSVYEAYLLVRLLDELNAETVCVVGEYSHLPRVLTSIFIMKPETSIHAVYFTGKPEPHWSIPKWKGYTNSRLLWGLWNLVTYIGTKTLTARFLEKRS